MPLPVIIVAAAAIAGLAGAGAGVGGAVDIYNAHNKEEDAKRRHEDNSRRITSDGNAAEGAMDELGRLELEVLDGFNEFTDIVSRIQNAPEFASIDSQGIELPQFNASELQEVAVVAKAALGGLAGAGAGAAGGLAAAGAASAIVSAIGTASTGTAIATLSGAAATNATLAALGGGALAAGGGGMALGSAVLAGATAGAGILVGGVIVNVVGRKLAEDANELERQVNEETESVNRACELFCDVRDSANRFCSAIRATREAYSRHMTKIEFIVNDQGKTDWNEFTDAERLVFENTVLLVGMLFKMCKTNLTIDDDGDGTTDRVNHDGINEASGASEKLLERLS